MRLVLVSNRLPFTVSVKEGNVRFKPSSGRRAPEFILALGDDWTDEDLFRALPPTRFLREWGWRLPQPDTISEPTQPPSARLWTRAWVACSPMALNGCG